MYFAMGVLTTGLLALTVVPAIWRRAARLTRARVEAAVPMSLAEIQADKDQLRAEFAIGTRRLELNVGKLEKKASERVVELQRQREEVARLTGEQAARSELIKGLEGRIAILGNEFKGTDERLVAANAELQNRETTLAERARQLSALKSDLTAAMQLTEEQQLELIARQTEIGNLKDRVASAKAAEAALAAARDALAAAVAEEKGRTGLERSRAESLEARLAALESERLDRLATLEKRATEIHELETELGAERSRRDTLAVDIMRLMAERDTRLAEISEKGREISGLRGELVDAGAKRREIEDKLATTESALAEARGEIANFAMRSEVDSIAEGDNIRKAIAATEAEKHALETRLAALEEEFAALRAENAELRRVAGAEWENERIENARLRDRLADIAGNIVKLTQGVANGQVAVPELHAEDGNGIERRRLPPAPPRPVPAQVVAESTESPPPPRPVEGKTLAERIRALQHSTARH